MSLFSFCGVALLGCALFLLLRRQAPPLADFILVAVALILASGILSRLQKTFAEMQTLFSLAQYGTLFALLGKCMGVALLVETVADICKDAGAESLAHRLVFLGKTEILLFALPLVQELLTLAGEVLQ